MSEIGNQLINLAEEIRAMKGQLDFMRTLPLGGGGSLKIIAVEYAEFTATQATSVGAGNTMDITNLAITHALEKATNGLLLLAQIGQYANSAGGTQGGVLFANDDGDIHVGDPAAEIEVGATGNSSSNTTYNSRSLNLLTVFYPATLVSKTYKVRARNFNNSTQTLYINRSQRDSSSVDARASSSFILVEFEA